MQGPELIKKLIEATGLPQEPIEREIHQIIARRGFSPSTITLDELRSTVAIYLQEVLLAVKSRPES